MSDPKDAGDGIAPTDEQQQRAWDALAGDLELTPEGRALLGVAPQTTPHAAAQTVTPPAHPRREEEAPPPSPPLQAPPPGGQLAAARRCATSWTRGQRRPRLLAAAFCVCLGLAALAQAVMPRPQPATALPPAGLSPPAAAAAAMPADATRTPDARPALRPSRAPPPWPQPQLTPLTAARVATLDCASLQAGVQQAQLAPGLRIWALFRLAWACDEAAALAQAVPAPGKSARRVSGDALLGAAGRAGLAILRHEPAKTPPGGPWRRTPQGRLVQALGDGAGPPTPRALAALALSRSLGTDAQIVTATADLQGPEAAAARRRLMHLIAHGDAMAVARASRALFVDQAWLPLLEALDARGDDWQPPRLLNLLVQASRVHRRWLLEMALRYQLATGHLAEAFEVARVHLEVAPDDAAAGQHVEALAALLHLDVAASHQDLLGALAGPGKTPDSFIQAAQAVTWPAVLPNQGPRLQRALQQAQEQNDDVRAAEASAALFWHAPLLQDPAPLALGWLAHEAALAADAGAGNQQAPQPHTDGLGAPRGPIAWLQRWASLQPNDDRPLWAMAAAGAGMRDAALRADALQALLLRHPRDAALGLQLCEAWLDAHQVAKARALLRAGEASLPAALRPLWLFLQARAVLGEDPLQARLLLAEANKLAPNSRNDILLADVLEAHGQLDEAAAALQRACATSPNDVALWLRRADLLVRQGSGEAAQQVLADALRHGPQDVRLLEKDAEVAHRLGDVAHAQRQLQAALAVPGAPNRLWLRLGRLQLLEMQLLPQGAASLRRAVACAPEDAEAHYLLGLALRDAGDEGGMRQQWQRYLALAPHGSYAAEVRGALRR